MNNDVKNTSENLISILLKKNNFYNIGKEGEFVRADSSLRNMLLLVISAQYPGKPIQASSDEIIGLKERAEELNREAWIALVTINGQEIFGPIKWQNLSK